MKPHLVPKPSNPSRDQVRKAAERFLQAQGVPPLNGLDHDANLPAMAACADHLQDRLGLERVDAMETAMLAWAELASRQVRCYVDLESSSPHLLFLVDPVTKRRHAIPVCDLVRLLGPREVG